MFPAGFFMVAVALWLASSAYKNRSPIQTLVDIIENPNDVRATLNGRNNTLTTPTVSGPLVAATPNAEPATASQGGIESGSAVGSAVVAYCRAQLGKPYKWGATGPDSYDCSGLMWAAYKSVGITIPRTTAVQIASGKPIKRNQLQPGDLIFPYPGHVFMYAGNGACIEAPHTGDVVKMTTVYQFLTARRYA